MRRRLSGWVAALCVLSIAACDQGPTVINSYSRGDALESLLVDASKNGPVFTEIYGNPFQEDKSAFDGVVIDQMSRALQERVVRFTTDSAAAPQPLFRIIVVFGGSVPLNGHRLCAGDTPDATPASDRVRVTAVACWREELWSEVTGHVPAKGRSEDDLFRQLCRQVVLVLLDR